MGAETSSGVCVAGDRVRIVKAGLAGEEIVVDKESKREPNSVAKRKRVELERDGYVVMGVAFANPETGRCGLLGNLGHVRWLPPDIAEYRVVFDGPTGADMPRFVEVEDETGKSIRAGTWHERENGNWELRLAAPKR